MNNELLIDYASKKIRFFNLIIDSIIFWIIYIIHILIFGDLIKTFLGEGSAIKNCIYLFLLYFFYNLIFEFAFSRTPGKLLTGTKVIDVHESKPNLKTLLIRNICRLIPFDALSFLISDIGWHDSISNTSVVNT